MTSADGCQTLVLELLEALLNIKEHYMSAAAPPAPTGSTGLLGDEPDRRARSGRGGRGSSQTEPQARALRETQCLSATDGGRLDGDSASDPDDVFVTNSP
jgi:hypothetical protein